MNHLPYPKITTRSESLVGGPWVATEKIHGANVVIATDGVEVRIGKRKAWLHDDEPFFGWQLLRPHLIQSALALHASLSPRASIIRIYGELFGGHYPHPSVTPLPGFSPVQTGIWYAPDIHFAVFDVLLEPAHVFLAFSELEPLARAAGLTCVPVLGRGPRATLQNLPVRYTSRMPSTLGLPAIPENLAEGFVLKADATSAPEARPVLKRKIAEFDEAKFDESSPWSDNASLSLDALVSIATHFVNEPRVASARSKLGDAAPRMALLDEVVLDILVDLAATFPRAIGALTPSDEEQLRAAILARVP